MFSQHWTEEIFFSLSGQYYIVPPLTMFSPDISSRYGVSEGVTPYPGIRAEAGWMFGKWSFAVESGFTNIKGDNPIITKITLIPLLLKTGYSFYPVPGYDRFNVTPTAALGTVFSGVDHYKDAIDMLTDKISHSSGQGLLFQAGARAGWSPFVSFNRKAEVFAGFSVDCIAETDGLIPLPQIEIGIIVRPFYKIKTYKKEKQEEEIIYEETETEIASENTVEDEAVAATATVDEITEETETEVIVEDEIAEETEQETETEIEETPEEIAEPVFRRDVWTVYFSPDVTVPTGNEIKVLQAAAAAFGEYTEAKITVQGYTAPLATALGLTELSRRRALFCARYLTENCAIPKEHIKVEWFGSGAIPQETEKDDYSERRCAVITIEGWINP